MVMLLAQCMINQNDVYIIHPIDFVIIKGMKVIWLTEKVFSSKTHFECIVPNVLSSLFDVHVTYYGILQGRLIQILMPMGATR